MGIFRKPKRNGFVMLKIAANSNGEKRIEERRYQTFRHSKQLNNPYKQKRL
jgi:hypothetical protein